MSAGIAENTEAKIKPLDAAKKSCEEVARASPGDTHKIASELLMVAIDYYKDVRRQAQQSFFTALAASLIGTIFFIYATWKGMGNNGILSQNGLIAGGLIQVIAGINFFLYGKASRQFASFHICLERSNRFLLSNTLCENITCPIKRDITRQEIIRHMLNAPMLTLDIINHGEAESRKKGPKQEMRKEAEVKVESLLS